MSATPNSRSHETCPIEADEIEQADTLAAREPPEQRQASGVDQRPVHWQPRLSVVPRSRRGSQNENGGDHGLRYHGKPGSRKQRDGRAAPRQSAGLPPLRQGVLRIRIHGPES